MAIRSPDEEAACGPPYDYTETSPLLPGKQRPRTPESIGTDSFGPSELVEAKSAVWTSWRLEAKTIAAWSAPMIVSFLLQRAIHTVSVPVVGRIGPMELGAVSLASVTANMIGNTLIQGLANGLDTLAAQAYGGGHRHMVGLHMQRMIYFIMLCAIPMMFLWWHSGSILAMAVPDQQVAELAGTYLRIMTARIPAFVLFECGKRFLYAQGLFAPITYVLLFAAPLNTLLMWVFVWQFNWGFEGAPVAIVITENLMVVLLFLYVYLIDGRQCWGGFTTKAFSNWGPMIRISVPGMVMHITEFAADEILTLASAQFGTSQLAAQSVLVTLASVTYNIPAPVAVAASNRVANWIGAGATRAAKTSAKVTAVFGLILASLNMVVLMALRYQIPSLFTKDPKVIEILIAMFPIATAMQTLDSVAAISHGLLRGIGWQEFGGYLNLGVYYLIAIPISFGTAFFLGWELMGLWTGLTIGLAIVCTVEALWLCFSDWDDAVAKAARRNE